MEGGAKRAGENKAGRGQGGERPHPEGGQGESGSRGSKKTDVAGTAEQGRAAGLRGAVVPGQEREEADRPERQPKSPEASLVGHLVGHLILLTVGSAPCATPLPPAA